MSIIGIDLGTTNTVAAIDEKVLSVSPDGSFVLPSVAAFPPSGVKIVGADARRRKRIDPKNTVFSSKRIIGRKWHSADTSEYRGHYPFDIIENDGEPVYETRAGIVTPVDIAATVLSRVGEHEKIASMRHSVKTVIAVPSLFGEDERNATIEAAQRADFSDVAVIDEPFATTAAYMSRINKKIKYAAVYDFGGGTFDLAMIDCTGSPYRILAYDGDLHLGGDDIDLKLATWAADEVLSLYGWDIKSDRSTFSRLVIECERAKIKMSTGESHLIDLMQVDPAAPSSLTTIEIQPEVLFELSNELVHRTFALCDRVLKMAGLKAEQIDAVFVAGGATLLQSVRIGVEKFFHKPVEYKFNPMHIVAIGASIEGKRR